MRAFLVSEVIQRYACETAYAVIELAMGGFRGNDLSTFEDLLVKVTRFEALSGESLAAAAADAAGNATTAAAANATDADDHDDHDDQDDHEGHDHGDSGVAAAPATESAAFSGQVPLAAKVAV